MKTLTFEAGTLLLSGFEEGEIPDELVEWFKWDVRVDAYRALAYHYAPTVRVLLAAGIRFADCAKKYEPVNFQSVEGLVPRSDQVQALAAWRGVHSRGIVVMPTGSGKSFLARMAILALQRPTLVVVPTIDLMVQWARQLQDAFGFEVGMYGGGEKKIDDRITVTTYDSAVLQMEFMGNRFGLVIFDECHHLPGPVNRLAATLCLAPYRLGLSATPDRQDGGQSMALLTDLLGPVAYRIEIDELEGTVLADYDTRRVVVTLDPDEREEYERHRKTYADFVKSNGISFEAVDGWARFLGACARSSVGREAFRSYLEQRRISRGGRGKQRVLWEICGRHSGERILVFTADNDTAYLIGRAFLLPVLTHRSGAGERKRMLERFRSGEYPILVTSKVLNEGVDVPEASVGVIVSGSGSIREHVQRLGRILRAKQGKRAVLYELVSDNTGERYVSDRRRQHRAYQRTMR